MGSGTHFKTASSSSSPKSCCGAGGGPGGEDDGLLLRRPQQQRMRTDTEDVISQPQQPQQQIASQNQVRHRNPVRFGRECLIALIVLIIVLCGDVVRAGQYTIIEAEQPPRSENDLSEIYKENRKVHSVAADEQAAEDGIKFSESEMERIQDLVLRGLNISRIPRASEINISQKEYEQKYRLYLERLNGGRRNSRGMMSSTMEPHAAAEDDNNQETDDDDETDLHIMHTFRPNSSSSSVEHHQRSRRSAGAAHKDLVFVRFPLPADDKLSAGVEEATLRLMLVHHPNHQNHRHHHHLRDSAKVTVNVYQLAGTSDRILLDLMHVDVATIGASSGKWIEFNVRAAVNSWIGEEHLNLGFEVDCLGCDKQGVQIIHEQSNVIPDFYGQEDEMDLDDDLMKPVAQNGHGDENLPALNIVSRTRSPRGKRSRVLRPYSNRLHGSKRPHHTKCEEHNGQKCCRSEMVVVFRDLKALDFIIQPKSFDAGHCRGKCPFNYNVASNHAYLQGMIWRQDRKKVPRPCCAPKKLEDLQVLHIDEQDPTKLKVSTWTEMRVLECACS